MRLVELATDRILNGLAKGFGGSLSPEQIAARLNRDVVIRCDPARCTSYDLWPAVWALASVLERQITGWIHIDAGISAAHAAPVHLGPRCTFAACANSHAFTIDLGVRRHSPEIVGDARLNTVGLIPGLEGGKPTAIECFLLAGYLGFNALATLAGIPPTRVEYARQ